MWLKYNLFPYIKTLGYQWGRGYSYNPAIDFAVPMLLAHGGTGGHLLPSTRMRVCMCVSYIQEIRSLP